MVLHAGWGVGALFLVWFCAWDKHNACVGGFWASQGWGCQGSIFIVSSHSMFLTFSWWWAVGGSHSGAACQGQPYRRTSKVVWGIQGLVGGGSTEGSRCLEFDLAMSMGLLLFRIFRLLFGCRTRRGNTFLWGRGIPWLVKKNANCNILQYFWLRYLIDWEHQSYLSRCKN